MTDIEKLKFNLQEKQFPYFDEQELNYLLEEYGTVNKASYEGCLIKAQDDSVKLGPIDTPSNEKYWLRRADHFLYKVKQDYRKKNGGSVISIRRADDI